MSHCSVTHGYTRCVDIKSGVKFSASRMHEAYTSIHGTYAIRGEQMKHASVDYSDKATSEEWSLHVASHKGFDLIQLSKATSPIFDTHDDISTRFPQACGDLLGAATVYSDTILGQ